MKKINKFTNRAKKQTIETRIENFLKKEGYTDPNVEFIVNKEDCGFNIMSDDNLYLSIEFNIDDYPHCCGMREIGNIPDQDSLYDIMSILSYNLVRDLMIKLLRETIEDNTIKNTKIGFSFTITQSGYELFEEAAIRVGFQLVGSFVNKNSNNTLNHYIKL